MFFFLVLSIIIGATGGVACGLFIVLMNVLYYWQVPDDWLRDISIIAFVSTTIISFLIFLEKYPIPI